MNKVIVTLILLALLVVLTGGLMPAQAQVIGTPSFERYDVDPEGDTEAPPAGSGEIDPPTNPTQPEKDSAASRNDRNIQRPAGPLPGLQKGKTEETESEDDSILSFNFLYYLIQKYKMQDIID